MCVCVHGIADIRKRVCRCIGARANRVGGKQAEAGAGLARGWCGAPKAPSAGRLMNCDE